ncbi:cysteine-rich venom protein Cau1-like [Sceloporus undulatus]|uniref:cysteine-rich venom protein Cau1-like n=1 Tax=Sceloporus undulatus TaxID=8520 RepID=UPI001C4D2239|nr:cysteine-rich venom protein Cau1-like [Sceloporus undulatus]
MWNEKAAMNAGRWVSKCEAISSSREERMVDGSVCGEITLQTNYPTSWNEAIETFASGQTYFQYSTGSTDPTKNVYGYTQIIWHNSKQVGCALGFCPKATNRFLYVCHYCPSGNIDGQLNTPYKSGPPCSDCRGSCEDKLCSSSCQFTDKNNDCENLIGSFTCTYPFVQERCPASCKCPKDE